MKRQDGFTLIELLAVILILGIISLIAIPTVTKMIEEAKMSALRNTAKNIINTTEDYVTKKYMTKSPVNNEIYRFPSDKKLELNKNPKNGYSRVIDGNRFEIAIDDGTYCAYKDDDEDNITVVKLSGEKCDSYINDKVYLKSYFNGNHIDHNLSSIKNEDFRDNEYINKIVTVTFDYDLEIPNNKVTSWDVSENNNGSIIAYIVENDYNPGYYDLYITSHEDIYANVNSDGLFVDMVNLYSAKFYNYNTSEVEYFTNFFYNTNLYSFDATKFDTSSAISLARFFYNNVHLKKIDLSSWNISNVKNISGMLSSTAIKSIDLSSWNTKNVTKMDGLFLNTHELESVNLSGWDTSNVENFSYMFSGCTKLVNLDLTNFDTSSSSNMYNMFFNTNSLEYIYVGPKWKLADEHRDYLTGSKISSVTVKP